MRKAVLLVLPLLLGAAPGSAAPDTCEGWEENGVHIAPIPIVDIARNPIPIADHMPVTHEVAQIATKGWLLDRELRIPGPEKLVYPAGTPLEPDDMERSDRLCLPLARPPFGVAPPTGPRHIGPYVEACLADGDGDGLHERIDIFAGDSALHVPKRDLARSEVLAVPQRLAPDPLGLPRSRRYVHREVTAYVDGPVVEGATLRLRIAHAFQDQDRYGMAEGSYAPDPDGTHRYRPAPPLPFPVSMTGYNYYGAPNDADATVIIADGAEVEVGGLKFRIDHYSHGFTLEPQAYRFPEWIRFGCGGRSVVLGAGG
jgi:hypothetical protein